MKLKIMKICTSRSWGGMELSMVQTCEKLRQRQHQIFPVCFVNSSIYQRLLDLDFRPVVLNLRGYLHPFKIYQFAQYIHTHQIDLIHADYSKDLWTVVPAMKFSKRVPLVLIKHVGTRKPKTDPFHKWIYRHVDYIIAISNVIKNNVIKTHPIKPEKVGVIHHGIDFKRFKSNQTQREKTRTTLGVQTNELLIGIIGRLQAAKGYFEFIEMARSISERYDHTKFIIIGEPSRGEEAAANQILTKIDHLNLPHRMIVTGYREDIPALLAAMDLFVFPSHAEAFGLVLIEAMGMKLPVVSSSSDGVLDIVLPGETGLLVPPKDIPQLIAAVECLIQNEEQRKAMGQAGYLRARQKFDEEHMLVQIEQLYYNLLQKRN